MKDKDSTEKQVKEKESATDKQMKVREYTTVKQVKEKESITEKVSKESPRTKSEKGKEKEIIKENPVVIKSATEYKNSFKPSTEKVKRLDDSPEYHDIDEDSEESGSSNGADEDSEDETIVICK